MKKDMPDLRPRIGALVSEQELAKGRGDRSKCLRQTVLARAEKMIRKDAFLPRG